MQTQFQKRDLDDFVEKNAANGAKCRLDSFSGRRGRGYLKFPSLGGPPRGGKDKKAPIGRIPSGGEIVALDGMPTTHVQPHP